MRLRETCILFLVLVCTALTCRADNLGYTKNHQLVFGIDMDYAPMEFVDEHGKPNGLDIEFTRRLMKRLEGMKRSFGA